MNTLNYNKIINFLNRDIYSSKIDNRIMSLFLKQLSLLLNSGLPLDKSIKIIEDQNLDKKLTKVLHNINLDLDKGNSVYESFYNNKRSFNPLIIAFIKSGDESGKLPYILDELSNYISEDSKNKSAIKQAFIYPIILIVITIIVIAIVINFVLPTFITIFENSSQVLPLSTRILLGIAKFFSRYNVYIMLISSIIILFFLYLRQDFNKKLKMDKAVFEKTPFKKFRLLKVEYQFSSLLYILKTGDIDLIKSLEIIEDSYKNTYIKTVISKITSDVRIGLSLHEAIINQKVFSSLFISMIKVGEDSGNMANSLKKSSDYYANEYIFRLQRISQLAEPVLILLMSVIVGFVVFSVAIPMFDSVNSFNY